MAARRAPEERGVAAARTRERIMEAAVAEFGAKGYAGARTAGIAARAGVNQQLIAYYFGGKQGLLDALRERWQETEDTIEGPLDEAIGKALDATLERPDWARLLVWQALGDCPFADEADGERFARSQRSRLAEAVDSMRRRQRDGEVSEELDPAFALLVTYALVLAPITMPQFVQGILGMDPMSPEYRSRCREELVKLLGGA